MVIQARLLGKLGTYINLNVIYLYIFINRVYYSSIHHGQSFDFFFVS